MVEDKDAMDTIINLFKNQDLYIRYFSAQIFNVLITNGKLELVQLAVLSKPTGINLILDLLNDSRDSVRNGLPEPFKKDSFRMQNTNFIANKKEGILLLIELSKDNHEIQKLTVFSNTFERIFEVIEEEGGGEGSEVVHNCLTLMYNLIENNLSTQNMFRETNCVQRLRPLLELEKSDLWFLTDNKKTVLVLTLKLVSLLVTGNNPSNKANQDMIAKQFFEQILVLSLGKVNEPRVRSQALRTLGNLFRGNEENRVTFAKSHLQIDKATQPALIRLTTVALNSTDFVEKLAAVHAFQV